MFYLKMLGAGLLGMVVGMIANMTLVQFNLSLYPAPEGMDMNDMAALNSLADLGEQINVPWLLVHGTEDDVVPIVDSRDILAKATTNPEFFEIAGADHVFSDDALPVMVGKVVEWVKAQAG